MFHDLGGDDPVEGAIGERKPPGIPVGRFEHHRPHAGVGGPHMACVVHHPGDGPYLAEFIDTQVARHHRGTPAECLVRVAAEPAAQIQYQVAGAQSQPVVVGGQHDPV